MPVPTITRLITFNAAAQRLAITSVDLCGLIVRGVVPRPVKLAGGLKFFESDIDGLLSSLRVRRAIRNH